MKFPFARELFPPLALTRQSLEDIHEKADALLNETLERATRLLDVEHGLVNEHAWKKLKQFDNSLTLYRERKAGTTGMRTRSDTFAGRDNALFATPPPSFLLVGQVLCGLDDLMYGMSTATAEEQRIRSSYMGDGIVDCQLLEQLHVPTESSPFHYRNLKWLATTTSSVPLTRPRDYVVVDEAGLVESDSLGPRIGYSLRHSVQLDAVQPLDQYKIQRGAMSMCGVFHEVYPSVVHVYIHMTFEPRARGAINKSLATASATEYANALARTGQVAQIKKLKSAVLATERSINDPSSTETMEDSDANPLATSYGSNATSVASSTVGYRRPTTKREECCGSCCQSIKLTCDEAQDATCALCRQVLCRHCRVRKELSFVGRYNRVHRSKYSFCHDCLAHSADRNALHVASQDLLQNELDLLTKTSPGTYADRSTATSSYLHSWHSGAVEDASCEWR